MGWVWLVLVILIAGTSAVIYYSTTTQISRQNAEMMAVFAESYYSEDDAGPGASASGPDADEAGPEATGTSFAEADTVPDADEAAAEAEGLPAGAERNGTPPGGRSDTTPDAAGTSGSGLFYAVEFDTDGNVSALINDASALHSNEEVTEAAQAVLEGTAKTGTRSGFCYLKSTGSESTLVVMMDNGIYDSNARVLLRNMLIFGTLALLLASVLSYVAAGRFVRPVRESYERQKQFISDAGHELKTPVSTISANAELLSREIGGNAWLENIRYENRRMSVMIRQMLDLARYELREQPKSDVDLSYLLSAGILPFEAACYERNLTIREEIAADIHISGNENQLGQLLSVLIDNAVEYSRDRGEIVVTLKKGRAGGQAVLSVSNEGEALSSEQRQRIFDAFTRGDSSRTERAGHYGLGLAIARAVVAAHGGRIDVTSEGGVNTFTAMLGGHP